MKKNKRLFALLLAAGLCLSACAAPQTEITEETEQTEMQTESEHPEKEMISERLAAPDGVRSVTPISAPDGFSGGWRILFEQPLDWKNPDAGTFLQRVELFFRSAGAVNCLETEDELQTEDKNELSELLEGNRIRVEHRFFGASVPEGLSADSVDLWQYMTAENAAADLHKIVSELKTVLSGKWLVTGTGNGGQTANFFTCRYPEDADLTVSYSVPCSVPEDERLFRFIYEEAGNLTYGEEEAARMRTSVTQFQVECIKNRKALAPAYKAFAEENGAVFRNSCREDILFDLGVLEFAVRVWQNAADFEEIQSVTERSEETEQKQTALLELLCRYADPSAFAVSSDSFSDYLRAYTERGWYRYDFSYLRRALEEDGSGARLAISEKEEEGILWELLLTKEQRQTLSYDASVYTALTEWAGSCKTPVFLLYGSSDLMQALRLPEKNNANITAYTNETGNADILRFPEEVREEIIDRIYLILS